MKPNPAATPGVFERAWWAGLLTALPLLAYYGATRGHFFDDDRRHLARVLHAPWALLADDDPFHFFRPVFRLSLLLDHSAWGFEPMGYVLTNLVIHLVNGWLVSGVVRRLLGDYRLGMLSGLLFAVHPLHGTSVSWISDRTDLLCTTFSLAAAWSYAGYRQSRSWTPLVALHAWVALALLTKEAAITLPLLLVVLDRLSLASEPPPGRATLRLAAPLGLLLGAYFGVRRWVLGGFLVAYEPWIQVSFPWRFPISAAQYALRLIAPFDLAGSNLVRRGAKMIAVLLVVLPPGREWLRSPELARSLRFATVWFTITLLSAGPLLNALAIEDERLLYLPSVGVCVLVAQLLWWLRTRVAGRPIAHAASAMLIAFVVIASSALAHLRSGYWIARTAMVRPIHEQLLDTVAPGGLAAAFVFNEWGNRKPDPVVDEQAYWGLQALGPPFVASPLDLNPDPWRLSGTAGWRTFLWNVDRERLVPVANPDTRAASAELPRWTSLAGWSREGASLPAGASVALVSPPLSVSSVLASGLAVRFSYVVDGSLPMRATLALRDWWYGPPPWRLYWSDRDNGWRGAPFAEERSPLGSGEQVTAFCLFDSYRWFATGVIRRLVLVPPPLPKGVSVRITELWVVPRAFPCG